MKRFPGLTAVVAFAVFAFALACASPEAPAAPGAPAVAPAAAPAPQVASQAPQQPAAPAPAAPAIPAAPAVAGPAPAPSTGIVIPIRTIPDAGEPKYGGIIRVQVHLDPTGVDLHTPRGASSREFSIAQPALNYLISEELGNPGVIVPELAESWEVSYDAPGTADWTFTLDSRPKWHNGNPVTAEDIKFNFDRVKSPPEGLPIGRARPVGTYYDNVGDVRIEGNKILVHTNNRSQGFLAAVALVNFPIYNKAVTEALPQPLIRNYDDLMGSGAFIPDRFEPGARYTLNRNPDYWEEGLPYLNGIEVLVMVDETTRLAAIRTEQVDVAFPQLNAGLYDQIKDLSYIVAYTSLGDVSHWDVQMNEQIVPWNDFRVRRAVSLGMDRNLVGQISERDNGSPYGILYPPGSLYALSVEEVMAMPGFAADKEPEFEEARKLLKEYSDETGYDFTQDLPMLTENRSENIEGATLLIQQLSNIGITGGFMDLQEDAVTEEREIAHDFSLMIRRFGGPLEPDLHLANQYVQGGSRNFGDMQHPEIDQMYLDQRNAGSVEERIEIIHNMARFFWDVQASSVPLWWRPTFHAYNAKVKNFNPTLSFSPDISNYTHVWLSE